MEKCDAASKLVSGLSNTSCNPGIITSWCNFHVFGIYIFRNLQRVTYQDLQNFWLVVTIFLDLGVLLSAMAIDSKT